MEILFDNNNWSGFSLFWIIAVIISLFVPYLAYRYRLFRILFTKGAFCKELLIYVDRGIFKWFFQCYVM